MLPPTEKLMGCGMEPSLIEHIVGAAVMVVAPAAADGHSSYVS